MRRAPWLAALAALLLVGASGGTAAQSADPVQKAKTVVRESAAQLDLFHREVQAENYGEALRVLGEYRDAVRSAHAGLKASGRDAEKKPSGFKNLEIHLRQSVQKLGQTILLMPVDQREPFEAIRRELDTIDKELIDALFPRQPARKGSETKPGP